MTEAGYGYWGFSPANIPEGGYTAYGVDAIGMDPNGNPSNKDQTLVDRGYAGCPRPRAQAGPAAVRVHQRRRHAARRVPGPALGAGRGARRTCAGSSATSRRCTASWGFRDTVNVDSGFASERYLSLDQGMVMAALGNALGGDVLRRRS